METVTYQLRVETGSNSQHVSQIHMKIVTHFLKTGRSDNIISMSFGWKWNLLQLSDGGHRQSDVKCGVHIKRITYCLRVETGNNIVKMRVRGGQRLLHTS
jgi:hypothetical protein